MLQFRRGLDLVVQLEKLVLDELLVRGTSLVGLGNDRYSRDVPSSRWRAHIKYQARNRRHLTPLSPPI